jgi:ABC-type lipoprotein release transport system permease subunit
VTWVEETQGVRDLQRVRQRGLDLLVVVLLGMSAAGIANTVLMAAYERTREVGTLRAMGMNERAVLALFLAEGTMLGVVGGALGAAAGGGGRAVVQRARDRSVGPAGEGVQRSCAAGGRCCTRRSTSPGWWSLRCSGL